MSSSSFDLVGVIPGESGATARTGRLSAPSAGGARGVGRAARAPRPRGGPGDPAAAATELPSGAGAFVHRGGRRAGPASADVAEPQGVGDPDAGQVHLVELGFAGQLVERPDL